MRHRVAADVAAVAVEADVGHVMLSAGVEAAADLDVQLLDLIAQRSYPSGLLGRPSVTVCVRGSSRQRGISSKNFRQDGSSGIVRRSSRTISLNFSMPSFWTTNLRRAFWRFFFSPSFANTRPI